MQLTDHEQAMLDGAEGAAVQQAMSLLCRYGKALGAERLVETNNVCGGSVGSLPNRRNVVSDNDSMAAIFSLMNLDSDEPLEIPKVKTMAYKLIEAGDPDYYAQQRVSERTQKLIKKNADFCDEIGIQRCNTCTPYQVGNLPTFGEHLAWMESSALVYANSILGARGNVEGAQSTASAMLTARIPYWGLHIPENRHGTHLFEVECEVNSMMEWGLMGYHIGEVVQEHSPVVNGLTSHPSLRKAKHFGAAAATSGGVEMYHLVGRTPEAPTLEAALGNKKPAERFRFGREEMLKAYENLNSAMDPKVDFIMLGCPHASIEQVRIVAGLLEDRKVSANTELWMFTPKALKMHADRMGYTKIIEKAGGYLMSDSCPALSRVHPEGVRVAATDSCKQAHYLPATLGFDTWFGSVEDCVNAAVDGRWSGTL
ncbi:MAG: aconitase X catalytic domain-containing protein [Pseudomonadota bacterium]